MTRCRRRRRLLRAARSGEEHELTFRYCSGCSHFRCICSRSQETNDDETRILSADDERTTNEPCGGTSTAPSDSAETEVSKRTRRTETNDESDSQPITSGYVNVSLASTPSPSTTTATIDTTTKTSGSTRVEIHENPFAPGAYTFGKSAIENPFTDI